MSFGWSLHPLTRFWELPQRQAQVTAPNSPFPAVQNATPGTLWLLAGEPHCTHIPSACILAAVPQDFPREEFFLVQAGMKLEVLPARAGATARQHPLHPHFPWNPSPKTSVQNTQRHPALRGRDVWLVPNRKTFSRCIFDSQYIFLHSSADFFFPILFFFKQKKKTTLLHHLPWLAIIPVVSHYCS